MAKHLPDINSCLLVVDDDGNHVESGWVERSNTTLANRVEREKGAKPAPPARKVPRKVAREKKAQSARARKPPRKSGPAPVPQFRAATCRRGMMPRTDAVYSGLTAAGSDAAAAGPSRSGGAPVAEMGDPASPWAAQVGDDYRAANRAQQEEADELFPVRSIPSCCQPSTRVTQPLLSPPPEPLNRPAMTLLLSSYCAPCTSIVMF